MRTSFPMSRRWRPLACAAVWTGCLAGALWLYLDAGGPVEAVAIAETKSYRVAAAHLGRLASVEVAEGQLVAAGQVVARLETGLIEKEIAVARAGLRQKLSEVKTRDAALETSFESEIESAQVALRAAAAAQARDAAALSKVRQELEHERGFVPSDRRALLEIQAAALEEIVRDWPARLAAGDARRQAARARLDAWRDSRTAQLLPVRDAVREREQSLAVLTAQLDGAVLRATAASYVSSIHARPGDVVTAGQPVLTLVEAQPRQVVAWLDERRGNSLAPGAKVVARRRDGKRQCVPGTVAALGGDVATLPQRLWTNPHVPAWGRAVYIEVAPDAVLDPGEVLDILRPEAGGAAQLLSLLGRKSAAN